MLNDERNLELVNDGVAVVAQTLADYVEHGAVPAADPRWDAFHRRLVSAEGNLPLAGVFRKFKLTRFEVQCLVLALAAQIEPRLTELLAEAGGGTSGLGVTVRLALDCFCATPSDQKEARQSFRPGGRLLLHRLLSLGVPEAGGREGLLDSRLLLPAPTLRFLLGETELAQDIARYARLDVPHVDLLNVIIEPRHLDRVRGLAVHHERYRELISAWGFEQIVPYGRGLTLLFSGPSGTGKTMLAQALAAHTKRSLLTVAAADLPTGEAVEVVLRDLFVEATMRDAIVLVDECESLLGKQDRRKATVYQAMESFEGILVLITNHPEALDDALERRIIYHVPFEIPDVEQRRQIWELHLPPGVPIEGEVDLGSLAMRYDFPGGTIKNAVLMAVNQAIAKSSRDPKVTMKLLEAGCISQVRYALESLSERTTTHLRLADIVLPDKQTRKVREILAACKNQALVLNRWGFGRRLATGKGIAVLFDGPPGTGKTFCAEIIAGELDRPLYRVNLPEVVSKGAAESERHIKTVFQQARISHAMLLFDEADALFASRFSDPRSAGDRHANLEMNLLLQELERFPGVAILTTNHFGAIDKALIRRIQFRATFEEPDEGTRAQIWRTLCPPEAPLAGDVDFAGLSAEFEMTGGQIKNALLRAAYMAADAEEPISQQTLWAACRDEHEAMGILVRRYD